MTVSEGIRGNTGLIAKFTVAEDPAIDFAGDIKSFEADPEDKDDTDLTFQEAKDGDSKTTTINITAIQSTAPASFWRFLFDNPGAEFGVTHGPHGNAIPTEDKPHFAYVLKANGRPKIGGNAPRTKERNDFSYAMEVLEGPDLIDAVIP